MPSGRTNNFPESGRGLGHVTPTIFGSTVGYPSDSLASCYQRDPMLARVIAIVTCLSSVWLSGCLSVCHEPVLCQNEAGARELSESCVSQNSGSLETEQPCVLAQGGGSGVSPPRNFCNFHWANLHYEPFAGENDLQNYMQS